MGMDGPSVGSLAVKDAVLLRRGNRSFAARAGVNGAAAAGRMFAVTAVTDIPLAKPAGASHTHAMQMLGNRKFAGIWWWRR